MTNKPEPCPCGSTYIPFMECCCREIIAGTRTAESAPQLLRARYTAFALRDMDFIVSTTLPRVRKDDDATRNRKWAETSTFTKFEVFGTEFEGEDTAFVTFEAHFTQNGRKDVHRARSRFERLDGEWFFVSDQILKPKTVRHEKAQPGRNEPCPCGSGKKYKKCCAVTSASDNDSGEMTELFEECSNCHTTYRFLVTAGQALRYYPPRPELIQDIFPEIPIPARAVLTQGHMCGLCLPQLDEGVRDIIRSFIADGSPAVPLENA